MYRNKSHRRIVVWRKLKSSNISPLPKNILWQISRDILPVKSLLLHRKVTNDDRCPMCIKAVENIYHRFFECAINSKFWDLFGIGVISGGTGGDRSPTFWSGWDGPLHFLMSKKPTKIFVPPLFKPKLRHCSLGRCFHILLVFLRHKCLTSVSGCRRVYNGER
jgi:hypothetical protein